MSEFQRRLEANIRESLRFAVGEVQDDAVAHMVAGVNAVLNHPCAPAPEKHVMGRWLPIEQADRTITNVEDFSEVGVILRTSDRHWVRDEDGRVYEAAWSEGNNGERDYWWDFEGESPVDPVEFMPHPLDPRFATTEGKDNG